MDEMKKDKTEEMIDQEDIQKETEDVQEPVEEKLEEEKLEETADQPSEKEEEEPLRTTLARLQADFQNYRNRTEKERASIYAYANEDLVKKLLPVIDNLERALASEQEEDAFYKGVKMIYDDLIKVLEKEGIVRFDPVGEKFDPNFHQAIFVEESDQVESEHIIETFQAGYMIKDKLIRPAVCKVAK